MSLTAVGENLADGARYDVTADGQRFLVIKPEPEASAQDQIVVVQNWFKELRQRVPVR